MTAHAMPGDEEKCLQAGCNSYLTKPICRKELLDIVQQTIEDIRPDAVRNSG